MKRTFVVLLAGLTAAACSGSISTGAPGDDAPRAIDGAGAPTAAAADLVQELTALDARAVAPPPSASDVAALVARGIPKPPDPRDATAHATLMQWSQDVLTVALRAATAANDADTLQAANELVARLAGWVDYGTDFGDPKDVAHYGNASLELTWFMGNLARAGDILGRLSDGNGVAAGLWSDADRRAFTTWAHAMETRYFAFDVFAAGLSNRKASQLETMMRIAALDGAGGQARLASLFAGLEQLVVNAIHERGDIPEDTPRDKYHPQFFLASTLQALELGRRHGLRLGPGDGTGQTAIARLTAALRYCADENGNDQPPPGYTSIGNAHANHDIPSWILAWSFFADYGVASPPAVDLMVAKNYEKPARIGLVMDWGFGAIAHTFGL